MREIPDGAQKGDENQLKLRRNAMESIFLIMSEDYGCLLQTLECSSVSVIMFLEFGFLPLEFSLK